MADSLNSIVNNARGGTGPCSGCPAQEDTLGRFVNPGLLNYDANLMFLTMDPSHYIEWDGYEDWSEYNAEKGAKFINEWRGGKAIKKVLSGISGVRIDDIWLGDAVKCPVENDRAGNVDTSEAFEHCSEYLRREIDEVDPLVIVTMGKNPAEQLLNGVFDLGLEPIKAGSTDCGTVHWTEPPVVISPHWANGWLGRNDNRRKVQRAITKVIES